MLYILYCRGTHVRQSCCVNICLRHVLLSTRIRYGTFLSGSGTADTEWAHNFQMCNIMYITEGASSIFNSSVLICRNSNLQFYYECRRLFNCLLYVTLHCMLPWRVRCEGRAVWTEGSATYSFVHPYLVWYLLKWKWHSLLSSQSVIFMYILEMEY